MRYATLAAARLSALGAAVIFAAMFGSCAFAQESGVVPVTVDTFARAESDLYLRGLIKDGGQIVNVSSGVTRFINPDSVGYATLKGAVEVFTTYLAHDLGQRNINVNTVAPGAIQTDFSGGVVRDNPAVNRFVGSITALGRPGLPEDIGEMLASLLSGANHWVNAQRIEVSGGMLIAVPSLSGRDFAQSAR